MPENDAASLLKKRQGALMEKWSTGKRLTPDEREEIAGLLPRVEPVAPALQLEAQVEGVSEKQYREGRATYATKYGQAVRTINRWMKQKAPLDDPAAMPAWWSAHKKHRVPEELLRLAELAGDSPPLPAAVGGRGPLEVVELSSLDQAREMANHAFAELRAAQGGDDGGRLALAQRAYKDASEQLRRVELADPKIKALAGSVVDKETLRSLLTDLHTSIAQSIRSFAKRMRRELMGKSAAEQENLWQEETDKLFARFRNFEFADPV